MLSTGGAEMARSYVSSIVSYCFFQGAHRSARLSSYSLLRQMSSFYMLDWPSIVGTMIQDAQSSDYELMANAY